MKKKITIKNVAGSCDNCFKGKTKKLVETFKGSNVSYDKSIKEIYITYYDNEQKVDHSKLVSFGYDKKNIIFHGYRELKSVYDLIKIDFSLKRFLLAFFVYSLALQTIMLVAAYFGEEEIIWSSKREEIL